LKNNESQLTALQSLAFLKKHTQNPSGDGGLTGFGAKLLIHHGKIILLCQAISMSFFLLIFCKSWVILSSPLVSQANRLK
jgi:hypothetical protein